MRPSPDRPEKKNQEAGQAGLPRLWFLCVVPLIFVLGAFLSDFHGSLSAPVMNPTPTLPGTPVVQPYVDIPVSMAATPTPAVDAPQTTPDSVAATPYPTLYPTREMIQAHLSWYWPPYGGMNCDVECEHLANGDDWKKWVGEGLACPDGYPLGTVFVIMGEEWECVDRGEAVIVNKDGTIWLDLLVSGMPYGIAWGSVRPVEIRR